MKEGKAVIFSAPSGSGKTTLVNLLIRTFSTLEFSISATTRKPRKSEVNKKDYYFLTPDQFREKIDTNAFVEWEEVYTGCYYGTLKSEMDRIWNTGKHVIFDVDVKGGLSLKEFFGDRALAIFVRVPSIEELEKRLRSRNSEDEESIQRRLAKARYEVSFSDKFDEVLVNQNLDETVKAATRLVDQFLNE